MLELQYLFIFWLVCNLFDSLKLCPMVSEILVDQILFGGGEKHDTHSLDMGPGLFYSSEALYSMFFSSICHNSMVHVHVWFIDFFPLNFSKYFEILLRAPNRKAFLLFEKPYLIAIYWNALRYANLNFYSLCIALCNLLTLHLFIALNW